MVTVHHILMVIFFLNTMIMVNKKMTTLIEVAIEKISFIFYQIEIPN